jgi:hypothetical protein
MLEASSEDQDEDEIVQSSSHKVFECENPQWSLHKLLNSAEESDPNAERRSFVRRTVERVTSCRGLLYQEKT